MHEQERWSFQVSVALCHQTKLYHLKNLLRFQHFVIQILNFIKYISNPPLSPLNLPKITLLLPFVFKGCSRSLLATSVATEADLYALEADSLALSSLSITFWGLWMQKHVAIIDKELQEV